MTRFGKTSKLVAASLVGALALTACSSDNGNDDGDSKDNGSGDGPSGTVTLAWGQPFDSYNNTTAGANSFANVIVLNWVTTGFWQFAGEDGLLTPNEEFGTYEQTSEDPLVVEYTINDDAVWSDGESIDCDDFLLWWAQQSGKSPFSVIGSAGIEDTAVPECEAGDKHFVLEYGTPYADWAANGPSHGNTTMMPAHVVADQGGISTDELIEAIKSEDWDALEDAAEFFNNGWLIDGGLPDAELIPSSGPYLLDSYEEGQHVTLKYNENYWGEAPATETIVIRQIAEPEMAQALENGEVDIIAPQPTVDMVEQINALSGINSQVGNGYTYEHLDFNFNEGPFSDNLALREAFALCVPRQLIVDNLIKPVTPDAPVKQIRNIAPWDPGFDEANAHIAEELEQYGEQDIERAREILEEEDAVGTTIKVQTLDNQRRNDTGALIKDACDEAGFDVDFSATPDFFATDGGLSQGTFDVAMFGWIGSSLISGWNSTFKTVEECTADGKGNNNGCYSNPEVDKLLQEVLVEADQETALQMVAEIEKILWQDLATIPIFQHPNITAWAENVENIVPNPTQTGVVWNMPEWSKS
ncbi:ABC transporter substrate-binding protein [Streptomyces sodiiphilus]|uniref:ABC transporter substrate-binding protein n=1 Tax=Streptomyces sodiiphilus TaxID=226217 RepID=A0ABN2P1C9_9ACTN